MRHRHNRRKGYQQSERQNGIFGRRPPLPDMSWTVGSVGPHQAAVANGDTCHQTTDGLAARLRAAGLHAMICDRVPAMHGGNCAECQHGRGLVTRGDSRGARWAPAGGRYGVAEARPRPPIMKGNVRDFPGRGPRADGDDTNAAVTTAAPGAVPPFPHVRSPAASQTRTAQNRI